MKFLVPLGLYSNASNPTGAQGNLYYNTDKGLRVHNGTAWVSGGAGIVSAIKAETGTTYTFVVGDVNKFITCDNSSAITVTIPPDVFAEADTIMIQQKGTGQVTVVEGSGVTITSTGATEDAPKTKSRYSALTIICLANNSFTVIGDVA